MKALWTTVLLAASVLTAGAQTIENTGVATVKLLRTTVITQKQWDTAVNDVAQNRGAALADADRQKVLESLIDAELLKQGAEKAGFKLGEADVLSQFRPQLAAQMAAAARVKNPNLTAAQVPTPTDDQIRGAVASQYGSTWDKVYPEIASQLGVKRLLDQAKATYPKIVKAAVTDAEVRAFYDDNAASFVTPDYIRVSHIFFDTKRKPSGTPEEIKKQADEVRAKIASGQATFEEMVSQVSDDASSSRRNGDLGYLLRALDTSATGQAATATYGRDFLRQLFALKANDLSPVLTSAVGYHIVKITVKKDRHFLGLDEDLQPGGSGGKVRDQIETNLENQHQNAYQVALTEALVADLRAQAGKTGIQYLTKKGN